MPLRLHPAPRQRLGVIGALAMGVLLCGCAALAPAPPELLESSCLPLPIEAPVCPIPLPDEGVEPARQSEVRFDRNRFLTNWTDCYLQSSAWFEAWKRNCNLEEK